MSFTSEITPEDLILYKEGDKIYSGGFQVNSVLLKQGVSPFSSFQKAGQIASDDNYNGTEETNSNSVSDLFKNLAIPSGLLYLPNKLKTNDFEENEIIQKDTYVEQEVDNDYVTDDIYDTLMDLASTNTYSKGGTRKKRSKVFKKNTRKNRKNK
jgi:hypothetical protein